MFAGPWLAERRAAIAALMEIETDAVLDVTKSVLRPAENYTAMDAFTAFHRLLRLRRRVARSPRRRRCAGGAHGTTPVPAGRDAQRSDHAEQPPRPLLLLRQSAGSLRGGDFPNGVLPNGIPMGVTLLAPAWSDRALIALARRLEAGNPGEPFALTSRAAGEELSRNLTLLPR